MHEDNNQITEIIEFFKELIAEETGSKPSEINIDEGFQSLGLDSVNAVFLLEKMERRYKVSLSPLLFWDYPTIKTFSAHIYSLISDD